MSLPVKDTLFRIEMLGRFRVHQEHREITRFRTQKTASLLACMALYPSRSHPRDVLVEQFWPGSEPKAARANLSVSLNVLRRLLEPPGVPAGSILLADHAQVGLNPRAFTTDVEEFENSLREAEGETEAAARLAIWRGAVDLYRGDLMTGYYDDWLLAERDRLRDLYLTVLRSIVKECAGLRQQERAIEYARRLVQADPLREDSHRILMRLLMAFGRPQEALHQYHECERHLRTVLQTAPSAATRELAAQLSHLPSAPRTHQASPSEETSPKETAVVPSLTADVPLTPRRIPLQFTRFFGREEEMARLVEWLHPAALPSPVITLTGAGGSGKTRLSIEVAGRVREAFPGGIWFVPLAEVSDPMRLGEALRDALELPRQSRAHPLDQVAAFLNDRQGAPLLILDNFEQITAGGAPLVWTLLNRVPSLRCLVTSRQPLSLPGEREMPLLSLSFPSLKARIEKQDAETESVFSLTPAELMAFPSVALFVDRAQSVRSDFQITPRNAEAVAAICGKLEGIPLAIELAAARARAMTPAQILERLAQRFELLASRRPDKEDRHRSLWAAIDWSYHLLSPDLQRLFARLSVFRGGWTLEAAESAATAYELDAATSKPEGRNILDSLTQLRVHSLIQAEESSAAIRFGMLETLREFAAEQLDVEEREQLEQRHAAYFHQWVTGARLVEAERTAWFERFEDDFDNLRALLAWSLDEKSEIEIGLQTASTLGIFWRLRGHISEGRDWYGRLLERAGETPRTGLGQALHGAATLAYMQGDFQAALPMLERCSEIAQTSNDESLRGMVQEALGTIAYYQGDYAQSRTHFESALSLARRLGINLRIASALGNLANVAQASGDFETSRDFNRESLEIWREADDRNGEARTLHNLANLAHAQGQLAEARAYLDQGLAIKRELADRYAINGTLIGIADVAMDQADYATAAAHARESLALTRELGGRMDLINIAALLINLVRTIGELEVSARMYSALEKTREEMNYPLPPIDREEYEQIQTALREALGTAAYETARAEGKSLSLEQILTTLEETLAERGL